MRLSLHADERAKCREIFSEGDVSDTKLGGGTPRRRDGLVTGAWRDGCDRENIRGRAGVCHLKRRIQVCRAGSDGWLMMHGAAGDRSMLLAIIFRGTALVFGRANGVHCHLQCHCLDLWCRQGKAVCRAEEQGQQAERGNEGGDRPSHRLVNSVNLQARARRVRDAVNYI